MEITTPKKTTQLLFEENVVDTAEDVENFNKFSMPTTWWERFKASVDENTVEQMKRNAFAFSDQFLKAADTFGRDGFDNEYNVNPLVMKSFGTVSKKPTIQEDYQEQTKIKSAEELNKKYNTDVFKFDMDEALAPTYLKNVDARKENEFVLDSDGGTGFLTHLAGGLTGFLEPTNLAPSMLVNSFSKGLKIAQIVRNNLLESVASEALQQTTRAVGSGASPSAESAALNVGIGTALGSAIGLWGRRFSDPTNPSFKDSTEAGKTFNSHKSPPGDGPATSAIINPDSAIGKTVDNLINDLHENGAKVDTQKLMDDLTPSLKPESAEIIKAEVSRLELERPNESVMYNEKDPITFETSDGSMESVRVFSTTPEEGIKISTIKENSPSIELNTIPVNERLKLESLTTSDIKTPIRGSQIVSIANAVKSMPLSERVPFLKKISDLNEGKAVEFDGSVYDFSGKAIQKDVPAAKMDVPTSELTPPKTPEEIVKSAEPDPRFGSKDDINAFEDFIKSEPVQSAKLSDVQTKIDESYKQLTENVKQGFVDKEIADSLESFKRAKADAKTMFKVQEAFIQCTKGNF